MAETASLEEARALVARLSAEEQRHLAEELLRELGPREPAIIDRGRGPEIAGTRVTVFDVLDCHKRGWDPSRIALWLRVRRAEVETAIRYAEEHREQVEAEYQRILDRCARGNSPETQARLDAIDAKYRRLWSDRTQDGQEAQANGTSDPR